MAVIADLIRNPVLTRHWMPDVETPDLIRGRDDPLPVRGDNFGFKARMRYRASFGGLATPDPSA
jgi:hypothetical protein